MTESALVIVDYQNIHLTAHELFAPAGTPKHETLVHPLHFANQVVGERNNRAIAAREASKLEMDYLMTMKHGQEASEAVSAFILKRTPDFSQFT